MKPRALLKLRLYVAGDSPNSALALANLDTLCRDHRATRLELEIVDLVQDPLRGLDDRILLTPTLVRLRPEPVVKVVGNLSDLAAVRQRIFPSTQGA